jgi:hypothetical protein
MPRALFVFIDGIGIGAPNASNPFAGTKWHVLGPLSGEERAPAGVAFGTLDATLAYPGLPQSATGQTVLFTGEDAMAVAGGHREGFPTKPLARLLLERSFLRRTREAGGRAAFLNGYTRERAHAIEALERAGEVPSFRMRVSASSLAAVAGGGRLCTLEDVHARRAATFDLTGEVCRRYGVDAPRRTLREAADAVLAGAREHDVSLFELFLTDKAGHAQDQAWARHEGRRVDTFLSRLLDRLDPVRELLVVTSDHGNLEDLSTGGHTLARVPLFAVGAGAQRVVGGAESLADVAPRLLAEAVDGAARSQSRLETDERHR